MKKIQLTIPEPCHERWDQMTQQEKGKFCSSCQKTVVDFSSMSDGQVAAFFKNPGASVCGRFHNDQLNRELSLHQKRLPWFQKLVRLSLPALALFLKSCVEKNKTEVMGDVVGNISTEAEPYTTTGIIIAEITPIDTTETYFESKYSSATTLGVVEEKRTIYQENIDSTALPFSSAIFDSDSATICKYRSEVPSDEYVSKEAKTASVTVLPLCTVESKKSAQVHQLIPVPETDARVVVYPNPVRAGMSVNISLASTYTHPELLQLVSVTGQLIFSIQQDNKKSGNIIQVPIPQGIADGMYILRLFSQNKLQTTAKLIVTK